MFCEAGRSPQHGWAGRLQRGTWEPEVIEFFSKALRPGDIVFDIGAYVGPYTLLASRLVGPSGHVFAFEPDPVAQALLQRNVGVNRALNVSVVPYAVGASDGWASLAYSVLGDSATRITAAADPATTDVPIVSLRTFCRKENVQPDVIKIDVEGAEAEVLAHPSLGHVGGARCVFVELHERELQARGSSGDGLVNLLMSQGGHLIEIADRAHGSRNIAIVQGSRATAEPSTPDASRA
jgi:FkbM family methyltransferase